MLKQEKLLKTLAVAKVISRKQAEDILQQAKAEKKKVEDIIVGKKILDIESLTKAKAAIYDLPYENLVERNIPEDILNIISSAVAENYQIICFDKTGRSIKVGLTDPDNFKTIEAVDFLAKGAGLDVKYYLISKPSFKAAFKQYKSLAKELTSALKTRAAEKKLEPIRENDQAELGVIMKSAPVTKIVSVIIRHAVEGGASDIHIEPLDKESRVRYRIDGILHTSLILPRSIHAAIVARIKVMAKLKLDETRIPQDGRIKLMFDGKEIDFRVSILPLTGAEKVVMRILDTSKKPPTLKELGYQGIQLKIIENNIKKTEGLFLATGPTGSGKSTTLFSLLNIINKEGINIVTLEDPVEYKIKGVNQSQIKPAIGYTFASGLRSFLRQDPDVIMVGEIRDEETAQLAIHAALTGHFVLSTIHTISAVGAIARLIDMKVEPFLVGSTINTVIAQRLARKICPYCKKKMKLPEEYLQNIKSEIKNIPLDYIQKLIKDFNIDNLTFYKGEGCPRCGNTGYMGRVAICEVLDVNNEIKELIISGKKNLSEKDVRANQKYINIFQDGVLKVLQGITTMEEVLRITEE